MQTVSAFFLFYTQRCANCFIDFYLFVHTLIHMWFRYYLLLPAILLVVLTFNGVVYASSSAAVVSGDSENYVTRTRGYCRITVPARNAGFASMVEDTCVHGVPLIFNQLGVDVDESSFSPVDVVVMQRPQEMAHFAPRGAQVPTWSGAVAFPSHHLVLLPMLRRDGSPVDDSEITLSHELSHVAFYQASAGAETPRWFSEGVAILQSEGSSFHRKRSIWWASLLNRIEPLDAVAKYPEGARAAEQAYAQAADFTAFLIEREGWNGVRFLLSQLQLGVPFEEAFYHSYGTSVAFLEREWNEQLFGSLGWLMAVTGDAVWLGLGALICIAGFFIVRRRKHQRLKEMEEEEAQLEQAIAAIDELIIEKPTIVRGSIRGGGPPSATPVMDRIKRQRTKIEVGGKFHTLH
ncbi:MAG: hypothetical protein JXX29_00560 [Deltaproteobacteria bacterium]|nr:hypothetical protein [Deltaproteobacteria bacterium]MBN2670128.1 hypothetical protein [Deltaproteobacteria bacterium]